ASLLSRVAHRIRAMVRARGLSAERRLPAVEPRRRRRRASHIADRTRARADARPPRGLSHAADHREEPVGWVSAEASVVICPAESAGCRKHAIARAVLAVGCCWRAP